MRVIVEENKQGIFAIPTPIGNVDVYTFIIVQNHSAVIIDTGLKETFHKIKKALEKLNISPESIRAIINTHSHHDHIGCNGELKAYARCPVIAHQYAVPWIENHEKQFQEFLCHFPNEILPDDETRKFFFQNLGRQAKVDQTFLNTFQFDLEGRLLRLYHAPGHSQDSAVIHDLKSNSLITGDALMGNGVGNTIPQYDDLKAYQNTISMVEKLNPSQILTAHFQPISGQECYNFIKTCQNAVVEIEQEIHEIIHMKQQPKNLLTIAKKLCQNLEKDMIVQSLYTVQAHLESIDYYDQQAAR